MDFDCKWMEWNFMCVKTRLIIPALLIAIQIGFISPKWFKGL